MAIIVKAEGQEPIYDATLAAALNTNKKTPLTRESVTDYAKRHFGYPAVAVELDQQQFDQCIEDSLRMFSQFMSQKEIRALRNVGATGNEDGVTNLLGTVIIQLPENALGVVDVKCIQVDNLTNYAALNIFELMNRLVFPKLPIGDWAILRMFYEMYQNARGVYPTWHYDEFEKKLYIDLMSGPYDVMYIFTTDLTLESISIGIRQYQQLFFETVIAHCKLILANIRGKFQGIPAPGGTLTTDAKELKMEGTEKIKEVREILNRHAALENPVILG